MTMSVSLSFTCNFCNSLFSQKCNLAKHLTTNKCRSSIINNLIKTNDLLTENIVKLENYEIQIKNQKNEIESLKHKNAMYIDGNNNTLSNFNNINMNIEINVNPITKLDIRHIEHDKLRYVIEKMDDEKVIGGYPAVDKFSNDKTNMLLSEYIKNMICDSEHPENHSVKYVKKHPPTYKTQVEDTDGNTVCVIKGLKDTCELLSDPILDQLKVKLREFVLKYKGDTEPDFDYRLYENAMLELKKELNKQNVKKALNSVLKNDILNNIEMKLTLSKQK